MKHALLLVFNWFVPFKDDRKNGLLQKSDIFLKLLKYLERNLRFIFT
ncbi:hypothetical protein D778_02557 [Xanthomarina gelatinilytica]|uniref:Uncharacterized protein n=1 Tax=Xanthomarina gelatinilytica TaxID=1137281 RepID=M7NAF2_9FLAO|nr:hypothetical protein D778_02557 [Xanthomarina gelatinilytica]